MLDVLIKVLADGLVVPIVLIGIYALLRYVQKGRRIQTYATILMAGLTAYLLAKLTGVVYQPEELRPFQQIGVSAGASYLPNPGFPSDHMLFVTAITLAVWYGTKKRALVIALGIMSLLVGFGRVAALVHTPLDILGGIVIACVGGFWYLQDGRARKLNSNFAIKSKTRYTNTK